MNNYHLFSPPTEIRDVDHRSLAPEGFEYRSVFQKGRLSINTLFLLVGHTLRHLKSAYLMKRISENLHVDIF